MEFFLTFHSHFRWFVGLLAAVLVVLKYLVAMLGNRKEFRAAYNRILGVMFVSAADLQALLGIILLISLRGTEGGFTPQKAEHITTMALAVVLAHLPARWRNAADEVRFRKTLLCYAGAMALFFVGIIRIRAAGWYGEIPHFFPNFRMSGTLRTRVCINRHSDDVPRYIKST